MNLFKTVFIVIIGDAISVIYVRDFYDDVFLCADFNM